MKGKLKVMIEELENSIPQRGRLSYNSENMAELRPKVDEITNLIIDKDEVVHQRFKEYVECLMKKERDIRDICLLHHMTFEKYSLYEKYKKDLYRRLGNTIISSLQLITIRQANMDRQSKNRLIQKRFDKSKRKALIDETLYLSRKVAEEAIRAFDEHMEMLDEMEYKRLVEEGIIEL